MTEIEQVKQEIKVLVDIIYVIEMDVEDEE